VRKTQGVGGEGKKEKKATSMKTLKKGGWKVLWSPHVQKRPGLLQKRNRGVQSQLRRRGGAKDKERARTKEKGDGVGALR